MTDHHFGASDLSFMFFYIKFHPQFLHSWQWVTLIQFSVMYFAHLASNIPLMISAQSITWTSTMQLSWLTDLLFHFFWYLHGLVSKWRLVIKSKISTWIQAIVTLESQVEFSLQRSSSHSKCVLACVTLASSELFSKQVSIIRLFVAAVKSTNGFSDCSAIWLYWRSRHISGQEPLTHLYK